MIFYITYFLACTTAYLKNYDSRKEKESKIVCLLSPQWEGWLLLYYIVQYVNYKIEEYGSWGGIRSDIEKQKISLLVKI